LRRGCRTRRRWDASTSERKRLKLANRDRR
jgi:hypothetical protein